MNDDDGIAECAADIATYGWIVMKVSADAGTDPDFAYSIGLFQSYGHPEIIIVGLPLETAHHIINDVGAAVRAGGKFVVGSVTDQFLEGYDVTFRVVPDYQFGAYLDWGRRYYAKQFPVLQLIYPDRHGRWPWHEAIDPAFRVVQPVLADEPEPPWARDPDD